MQLNNICDVIENLPLPELETSRLQRMRSLVDNSGYPQVIPEHESSLSVSKSQSIICLNAKL